MTDGLKDTHREAIIAVIAANDRVERAVLFGSRATGTNAVSSDVDIALFGERLTLTDQARLAAALDEIPMAQSVDLLLYDSIRNGTLQAHIRNHGVQWYARRKTGHCVSPNHTGSHNHGIDSWQAVPLDLLVEDIIDRRGVTPLKLGSEFKTAGYRVISAKLIESNRVNLSAAAPRFVDEDTYRKWMRTPLREDDVILTSEAPLGKAAYVTQDVDWCLGQRLFGIRTSKGRLYGRFLFYALQSDGVQHAILARASGTTAQGIRQAELRQVVVPVPGLSEQRAIAHILGALDDKIELNRRMNATLEAMARALFRSWFVDFDPVRAKIEGRDTGLPKEIADLFPDGLAESELGEIPKGWIVSTLGSLCHKPQYGYTASARSEAVGPRFLRITDINKESWVSWSRVPYCEATEGEFATYRLTKGDLLIARMADPGHGILVEENVKAVFASYLIRFRPVEDCNARLLQYWLKSDAYWQLVRGQAAGTTRVSLNARVLSLFSLVVPPAGVASAFAAVVGALRERLVQSAAEMQLLGGLRDTLLPKLVAGELRVTGLEPASGQDDQPASVGTHRA